MSALDDLFGFHDLKRSFLFDDAEVAERPNAPVLKTGGPHGSEGSNPSFSVEKCRLGVMVARPSRTRVIVTIWEFESLRRRYKIICLHKS